ncbi:MAG: prepilin-type N-terminal cleavage/methylation domain-containing protein, partial [Candidatus Harrisonbacteria bacterium]|nr:prepilin-type N-terminal cleavage/methylation domain-containing protein [Candidatus Harrisonbacteria bacterium]
MKNQQGFTLIEILIASAIFLIVAGGIIFSYANVLEIMNKTADRALAITLLERELEIIRSLDYDQVGILG